MWCKKVKEMVECLACRGVAALVAKELGNLQGRVFRSGRTLSIGQINFLEMGQSKVERIHDFLLQMKRPSFFVFVTCHGHGGHGCAYIAML